MTAVLAVVIYCILPPVLLLWLVILPLLVELTWFRIARGCRIP